MTIRFLCPLGHKLAVPDKLAGKKGRCPICKQRVYIPQSEVDTAVGEPAAPPLPDESAPEVNEGEINEENIGDWLESANLPGAAQEQPQEKTDGGRTEPQISDPASADAPPDDDLLKDDLLQDLDWSQVDTSQASPSEKQRETSVEAKLDPEESPPAPPEPQLESPPAIGEAAFPSAGELFAAEDSQSTTPSRTYSMRTYTVAGYEVEPHRIRSVNLLAIALAALVLMGLAPALKHLTLAGAPGWAQAVIVFTLLQAGLIAWIVSIPDWATLWTAMLVFAVVAAIYAMFMALVLVTPRQEPVELLDLEGVRNYVVGWCSAMTLLYGLMTYLCGRMSGRWQRQYQKAARKETPAAT